LAEFAKQLAELGVELYSTGGTRQALQDAGLSVIDVAEYTGFPEMLDGRVKTLHPKIHGGILARHDRPDDLTALADHGIRTFELVIVNLYPFAATIAQPGTTLDEAIENIDIGGPSLLRGAAKNHAFITVVTDPAHYEPVMAELQSAGCTTPALRQKLAQHAFAHTAQYDATIARYLGGQFGIEPFPAHMTVPLSLKTTLRYGENPHQAAALYGLPGRGGANLVDAEFLNGKELSYNNLLDLDSALAMVRLLADPACVVLKHNNPCGAAVADQLAQAASRAMAGDPVSAFGAVLGFNRPVDEATAEVLVAPGTFIEAIVAPDFTAEGLKILTTRPKWKSNVRLLKVGGIAPAAAAVDEVRQIFGGLLVQQADILADDPADWRVATETQPTATQLADMRFAWSLVRYVKSNAIVVANERALWGVGAGQMSRIDSTEIALRKAGDHCRGGVIASDAFFPFADSIHQAAAAGIAAIVQPGGSKRDDEVIAAANEHGIALLLTGKRHFKH
jgi:phosphoribosylaminoimidazolecarboxamide formyltransferase/IMP cyclohydrolase